MLRHRQLLALLLVVAYTAVSTLGMAFVVCVESDGRQNVEALGAACCEADDRVPADGSGDDRLGVRAGGSIVTPIGENCGGCDDHLALVSSDARRADEAQSESPSAPVSPPARSVAAWPVVGLERAVLQARAPPLRPSATIACLRSVILRC